MIHGSGGEKVTGGSLQPDQEPGLWHLLETNMAICRKLPSLKLLLSGHCPNNTTQMDPLTALLRYGGHIPTEGSECPLRQGKEQVTVAVFGRNGNASHVFLSS